jgi:hypothetical protein
MTSKFRTLLTISWKLCPNVAIYDLCGGVYSIFTYYFGKNRRMKTVPTAVAIYDQQNRIVWRWVNISPKPFQPGKNNVNVHPSTAATASAGAFNMSLWLIALLDRVQRSAINCPVTVMQNTVTLRPLYPYVGCPHLLLFLPEITVLLTRMHD